MARSATDYSRNELYWTDGDFTAGLSYPVPKVRAHVHNANLLGAALLCRMHTHTNDDTLLEPALRVARFSASRQREDGSWYYGEYPTQQWIDNFHTGYNLTGLNSIRRHLCTREFDDRIARGFEFYRSHFIRDDGAPRYFHDRTYPIDVHCVSQTIITLLEFQDRHPDGVHQARSVLDWAMAHMWDERGFFYYRVLRLLTIRTSYMRWSQSWMLLALATLLEQGDAK